MSKQKRDKELLEKNFIHQSDYEKLKEETERKLEKEIQEGIEKEKTVRQIIDAMNREGITPSFL